MFTVGITGGIGSGKTTVCKIFEVLGIPVYYADERAKYLLNNDKEVIQAVKKLLGAEAYQNNKINRKYISEQVFTNAKLLSRYNAIVHPAVAADTQQWANNHAKAPYILKEAALLVETGSYKLLDKLIVVTAPVETRIQRVIQRDNIERHEVEARLKHQLPDEEKINYADFIIVNDGEKSLINQVSSIHTSLLSFIS